MASLIPPKRRGCSNRPRLTLSMSTSSTDSLNSGQSGHDESERTIMPQRSDLSRPEDLETHMDEIKRMINKMQVSESLETLSSASEGHYSRSSYDGSDNSSHHTSWGHSRDSSSSHHSVIAGSTGHESDQNVYTPIPAANELVGNLEVLCSLGEGASGEVAKVRIRSTGQIIARKVITTSPDPTIHRQLLRELNVNQTCRSEYIVQYYGAFFEPDNASITICMEYCEAGSMDSIYRRVKSRGGRIGEKVLAKLAESILKGLDYLYSRRIIHRDIKPSNILVTKEGQMKLCDFGVSGELINSVAGTFTGTSTYMAPERIMGQPYTITSDVWSLGVTILELALNRYPFTEDGEPPMGPIDLLTFLLNSPLPTLKDDPERGVRWSRSLRDLVERCLIRDGTKRDSIRVLLQHPLVKRAELIPNTDMARFVAKVWNWPVPEM